MDSYLQDISNNNRIATTLLEDRIIIIKVGITERQEQLIPERVLLATNTHS
jgi:hypothetical protein